MTPFPGNLWAKIREQKPGRMNSSTFNFKNTIFILLFAIRQLSFTCFPSVSLGFPVASRNLCKRRCLGQGLNNLLSLVKEFKKRFPFCNSHFLFGGLQLIRERVGLGSCSRILLSTSPCYYFLLWETLVDMLLQ